MKKNKLITIIILIYSINIGAQSINAKIIYGKKSNVIIDAKKKNSAAGFMLKEVFINMKKIEYLLKFNEQKSIFEIVEKMDSDLNRNSMSNQLSKSLGGGDGTYYTNRKNNSLYHQKEFESNTYLIKHLQILDWKLEQEKKKIGKYICYKATKKDYYIGSSGRKIPIDIIAWYTPEIPFSFGPLKYNGLPGLIIELSNNKVTFFAKEIQLNLKENIDIMKPKKGKEVTQIEYDSIITGLAKSFRKRYKRN
jgi:GLPGLI family protein